MKYKSYCRPNGQLMRLLGHRGLSSCFPENTLQAIHACYQAGADGYELDIQVTLDCAIALHDPELQRTAKGWMPSVDPSLYSDKQYQDIISTPVYQLPFATTQLINVGTLEHPEAPPLLETVLSTMVPQGFFGLIEVKNPHPKAKQKTIDSISQAIHDTALKTHISVEKFLQELAVISFDDQFLAEQKKVFLPYDLSAFWIREFNFDPDDRLDCEAYVYRDDDLIRAKEIGVHFDVESCEEATQCIPQIRAAGFTVGAWVRGPRREKNFLGTDGDYFANLMKNLDCDFFTSNLPPSMEKS